MITFWISSLGSLRWNPNVAVQMSLSPLHSIWIYDTLFFDIRIEKTNQTVMNVEWQFSIDMPWHPDLIKKLNFILTPGNSTRLVPFCGALSKMSKGFFKSEPKWVKSILKGSKIWKWTIGQSFQVNNKSTILFRIKTCILGKISAGLFTDEPLTENVIDIVSIHGYGPISSFSIFSKTCPIIERSIATVDAGQNWHWSSSTGPLIYEHFVKLFSWESS